ncbi:MAG: transcription antitermination factor NusB [Myxococcales bacterium]|nr:transcription antitermination factor NusB [Myxococcota bacterium]MDW8280470.1 transcription antitermination factor NusB [Myxococcales bacterium]
MGSRRRARERALQVLCLLDVQPDLEPSAALELYYQHLYGDEERDEVLSEEGRRFTAQLVSGVRQDLTTLDELIAHSSRNWRLERMNWVDRNLLRLAAWELRSLPETPAKVVLNEAIEMAKRYGTTDSSAFVNGVLDRLLSELGRRV